MRMFVARRRAALMLPALVLMVVACSSQAQQPRFLPVTDAILQTLNRRTG